MSGALLVGGLASQPGSGCVLPPDLNPAGGDAGPSSPPVILEVTPPDTYSFPGPIQVSREDSPDMLLRVVDNDPDDVIYVRLYRDYKWPRIDDSPATPALADCLLGPDGSGALERNINCQTNALCNGVPPEDNNLHSLQAMVSDRPFLLESDQEGEGQDAYRKVADFPRAGRSFLGWLMRCLP